MKKIVLILSSVALFSLSAYGQKIGKDKNCCENKKNKSTKIKTEDPTHVDLTCKLTTEDQVKRSEELRALLFTDYEKLNELPDGVELVYADSKKSAPLLVEFINAERDCCPFYTFLLRFDPNSNKVSLTIGGSEKIKEMAMLLVKP